jgi:hypothetical protein
MRWGIGKVEVTALRREILEMLERGLTVSRAHAILKADGRVTVNRWCFNRHVSKLRSSVLRSPVGGAAATNPNIRQTTTPLTLLSAPASNNLAVSAPQRVVGEKRIDPALPGTFVRPSPITTEDDMAEFFGTRKEGAFP